MLKEVVECGQNRKCVVTGWQCFLRNSISVRSQDSLMRGEAFGQMFACLFTANPIDRVAQRVGFPIGKRDVWTLMFAHRSV